jgi:hypothetical protein
MKRYFFILIFILIAGSGNKLYAQGSCACSCLKPLFEYLIASHRLFTKQTDHIMVSTLVGDANRAGFRVSYTGCPILTKNINKYFYALTTSETGSSYKAMFGDCSIVLTTTNNASISFYSLFTRSCDNTGIVYLAYNGIRRKQYLVNRSESVSKVIKSNDIFPAIPSGYPYTTTDTTSGGICAADSNDGSYMTMSVFAADSIVNLPTGATIISAGLHLFAKPEGYHPPVYTNAHTILAETNYGPSSSLNGLGVAWNYSMNFDQLAGLSSSAFPTSGVGFDAHDEDLLIDISDLLKSNTRSFDNGFILKNNSVQDSILRYNTFCSQRYPDAGKRPYVDVVYTTTGDSTIVAQLRIDSCYSCNEVLSGLCYSAVTDTSVNPYTYGITGNWRSYRSYSYYGDRLETDPSVATNIRRDGTIKEYSGFWKLVNGTWKPQRQDTGRWVWNSEVTLHNRRGMELENKDPLDRFNAGIYGYDEALPIAIIQNAKYRESAFDGFEDYFFEGSTACEGGCDVPRSFDFSSYKRNLDSTEQHTGKYSLRIAKDSSAGISAGILPDTANTFGLSFNTTAGNCPPAGNVLKSIKAGKDALLPGFSPLAGKKIVISAWVKEAQPCKGDTYTGNQIGIVITRAAGNITVIAKPLGGIIEGWQRYEQVIDIPVDATMLSVNMQATGTTAVYFDDLRIHPYNASMKSFVYNPETLRLMAELDENNYATMYEYDDDGTLIRLKKETERGIKTISETRSALSKEE